jgi:hypothetical protein
MATNINPNYNAATEQTNQLYNTQIPALSEDANIQEALRLYHYGVGTGLPTTNAQIQANSMAGHLKSMRTDIQTLQAKGAGSDYSSTLPTSVDDGYIWVDSTSAAAIFSNGIPTIAFYQSAEPSAGLVAGMLWVDSDDNSVYIYNGASWDSVASSGDSSYTPGSYAELSLTGLDIDVSAPSTGQFQFNPGSGNEFFGATITVTSGYTKNIVTLSVGSAVSAAGIGQILLQRVINADPLSTTTVAAFSYANGNLQFTYTDDHGQSAGTAVSYILTNITTDSVTFSSSNSSAIQISAQEVA